MKKFAVMLVSALLVILLCFSFGACDALEGKDKDGDDGQNTVDLTPYAGTYYFVSQTTVTVDKTSVIEVDDSVIGGNGITKNYMVLTLTVNANGLHYELYSSGIYVLGTCKKDASHKDTFNFYNSNGVLHHSATIVGDTYTRTIRDRDGYQNEVTTTIVLRKG